MRNKNDTTPPEFFSNLAIGLGTLVLAYCAVESIHYAYGGEPILDASPFYIGLFAIAGASAIGMGEFTYQTAKKTR